MQTLGYVAKYKGGWRLKQEIEILNRQEQDELATEKAGQRHSSVARSGRQRRPPGR